MIEASSDGWHIFWGQIDKLIGHLMKNGAVKPEMVTFVNVPSLTIKSALGVGTKFW